MDRSFLSQAEVIAASREFVCVRLMTYESAEEAELLERIFTGPTGQLENTVFALLSPDASTFLARPGRSPSFAFRSASDMATEMRRLSAYYKGRSDAGAGIPYVKNVLLALDVAASDGLPLVVLYGETAKALRALEARVGPMAWSARIIGRAIYASTTSASELAKISGVPRGSAVLIVAPGTFGVDGRVLRAIPASTKDLELALAGAVNVSLATGKDTRTHIEAARRQGIQWDTEIPVTDPHDSRPAGARRR